MGDADGNSYRYHRTIPWDSFRVSRPSLQEAESLSSNDETEDVFRNEPPRHALDEDPYQAQQHHSPCAPSFNFQDESTTDSDENPHDATRRLLQQAYEFLQPGCLFRVCIRLYADRKMLVLAGIHLVATLTVWGKQEPAGNVGVSL